ncbi:DNA-directed RNA polymerase III subunit RPC4 isoform X2 [Lampetra fluviatilis]
MSGPTGSGAGDGAKPPAPSASPMLLPGRKGPPIAGAPTPGRLPSIRSRDLTLGGVKKKTFAPNIPVRKVNERPREEGGPSPGRGAKPRGRERGGPRDGRGRGRGRGEVIQSHSIFEQGPADGLRRKTGGWEATPNPAQTGLTPIINIKKEKCETEEETKKLLNMLERDDFVDDPGLVNDPGNLPIQLPLSHSGDTFRDEPSCKAKVEKMEVDPPQAVKVKQEPGTEVKDEEGGPVLAPPPHLSSSAPMTLPDTLPGQPASRGAGDAAGADERSIKREIKTEDGQTMLLKQEKAEEAGGEGDGACTLRDLSEGQVGRLIVRASGKVQLVLGTVKLDVGMGTNCSFLQELVSVRLQEGRTGDATVLGHVCHRLICTPNFESLLHGHSRLGT